MINEYNKLLEEQRKQRIELKTELEIKKFIERKTKIPFKIYTGGIPKYGYFGSIKFKDLFREPNLNKKELNELIDLFKPVKLYKVENSCLSFRVIKENEQNSKEINPYLINYEGLDTDVIIINWFSKIKGAVYEIECYINDKDFINEFADRCYRREEFKGGYRIIDVTLNLNGNFADGKYKAIKWGRGTEEYKNDFTIYTESLDIDFKDYLNT